MKLAEILNKVKTQFEVRPAILELKDVVIEDVAIDSRLILSNKNTIFFALDGKNSSGEKFVADAILKGAKVVVAKNIIADSNIISIATKDVFNLLVEFLKIIYNPLPTNIYAVTGTNGKTSVAEFIRQILEFLHKKSASIGTLGVKSKYIAKNELINFDLTTPDIVSLYKNLFLLKNKKVDDVAIEMSSIGLEQGRADGVEVTVAAFTNFSQDHLDYHQNLEEYFKCKMLLFTQVLQSKNKAKNVVLNADIAEFEKIKDIAKNQGHKIIEYGFKAKDFKILNIAKKDLVQEISFLRKNKEYKILLNIAGDFQVYNVLCALAMIDSNYDLLENEFIELLSQFFALKSADGRMQKVVVLKNKAEIFIDFAHSPDALENVLNMARSLVKPNSRLVVLFGCGGNRDNKKRAIMGKIASNLADLVIVTDDNPRLEEARSIRKEILSECNLAKTIEIANRKEAITQALKILRPDDVLILAGKGHEKYQIIGLEKFHFDEEEIVMEVVKSANL